MLQIRFKKKLTNILKLKKTLKFQKTIFFKKLFFKSVENNSRLTTLTRIVLSLNRVKSNNQRFRNVCIITGKHRSIINKTKFKRQIFKNFLTVNNIPNLKKVSK